MEQYPPTRSFNSFSNGAFLWNYQVFWVGLKTGHFLGKNLVVEKILFFLKKIGWTLFFALWSSIRQPEASNRAPRVFISEIGVYFLGVLTLKTADFLWKILLSRKFSYYWQKKSGKLFFVVPSVFSVAMEFQIALQLCNTGVGNLGMAINVGGFDGKTYSKNFEVNNHWGKKKEELI